MKPTKINIFLRPRLTLYLPIFFIIVFVLFDVVPEVTINSIGVVLFAINTLLLGLFVGSTINGAKGRIEKLAVQIRQESITFYKAMFTANDLPDDVHLLFRQGVESYLKHKNHSMRVDAGRDDYEALIALCVAHNKQPAAQKLLDSLVDNEQNRTQIAMQLRSKVFSHEWLTIFVLYGISMAFLLTFDYGESLLPKVAAAAFGACLSLSLMILWKLSTLTHKKAWQIWEPYVRLIATHFQELD
jgi:Fe2+ transport system protein B